MDSLLLKMSCPNSETTLQRKLTSTKEEKDEGGDSLLTKVELLPHAPHVS